MALIGWNQSIIPCTSNNIGPNDRVIGTIRDFGNKKATEQVAWKSGHYRERSPKRPLQASQNPLPPRNVYRLLYMEDDANGCVGTLR